MNFVHLNVHSHYSKGWGLATAEELCKRACDYHMKHIALTDTNSLYDMVSFIKAAKQYGLKPIVGSELETKDTRAVLLVKDRDGYANLCQIISDYHCDQGFDLIHALRERRSGLVVFSDNFTLLKALKR